ncbi:hypothetical protein HMPREF3216_00697 [Gardnerella vaginalis]|uniref:Uncharacterized protein n=1 Tax=Gardnerella vaginalis TaxID=2702 RepID=A0A133NPN1_GARVA|nr:hypothetical protein HMPREF3216_00697 [Gardnerella vaginalis]
MEQTKSQNSSLLCGLMASRRRCFRADRLANMLSKMAYCL